jgi:hypothetical protein
MRPADDIKRLIDKAKIASSSQVDRRILSDALEDLEQHRADRLTRRPGVWRIVMRTRIGKFAVAAAVLIGLLVLVQQFGGPAAGTGVAWGDIRDAFLQQHWVHVKYDNGDERWSNLQTGDSYLKNWDGRCVAVDYARNLRQVYYSAYGQHISEDRPVIYRDSVIPPWQPETAWESVIGPWERMAEHGGAGDWEVERHPDQTGGEQLIRFDCYFNDATGRRLLIRQIWADPKTRLPLNIWERLQLAEREEQKRESITGTFDFPQTGPASLYDLGVPRDLPIAKGYDKVPAPSVEKIRAAAQAALERFPSRYRVVVWDNTRESEIDVIWRNGGKLRMDHYFNLRSDRHPQYHLVLPAQAQDVLQWTQTQPPITTYLSDGEKTYTRDYVHPVYPDSRNEVRVLRLRGRDLFPSASKPIEEQWPYANYSPAGLAVIDDAPEELRGYIGLRIGGPDTRQDFYIDPQHDSICVRRIRWKPKSGDWVKDWEEQKGDLVQLPQGPWYAAQRVQITYLAPDGSMVTRETVWNIDVTVLREDEFPPDTFNGDKLLEGAKVETY